MSDVGNVGSKVAINTIAMTVRTANVVARRLGQEATIDDVCAVSEAEWLRELNFGKVSLKELKAVLATFGRYLGDRPARETEQVGSWIDISTAPKDGTVIDLWCIRYELPDPLKPDVKKVGKRFIDCRWIDPSKALQTGVGFAMSALNGPAPAKWEGNGLSKDWLPTHWSRATEPTT